MEDTEELNTIYFQIDTMVSAGVLNNATNRLSWIICIRKTALNAGSSKHGNAVLANVSSNCVVAKVL